MLVCVYVWLYRHKEKDQLHFNLAANAIPLKSFKSTKQTNTQNTNKTQGERPTIHNDCLDAIEAITPQWPPNTNQ
jgi:hypothetical protein